MTLPGPEATRHWQGRVLVDGNGDAVGSIEVVYFDKATGQPEWARLETSTVRPAPTIVPLAGAREEGDTVRVPFAKTLVERAPSVPAGRELSEDQEEELYRHYGVPYSRAESPSGLPTGEPLPAGAGAPPSETPVPGSELGGRERVRISDPRVGARVGAAAGVALAVAAGVWRREWIGRQISTAFSRLGAIPRTSSRRRRRRRRAKARNQAMARTRKRTTALAWGTGRALATAALLPVTSAVQGGRRTRASVQAAQAAIRQRGARLRPRPRRKQRRGTLGMVIGGTAGYVLGARAGEQRYQQIAQTAKRVSGQTLTKLDQLSGQAADRLQKARQPTRSQVSSSGTAAPDTPPEPPS